MTAVLGLIVLLFQAISSSRRTYYAWRTRFSMAIFRSDSSLCDLQKRSPRTQKTTKTILLGVFAASAVGDLLTYVMTDPAMIAHRIPRSGFFGAFGKFAMVFAVTRSPGPVHGYFDRHSLQLHPKNNSAENWPNSTFCPRALPRMRLT